MIKLPLLSAGGLLLTLVVLPAQQPVINGIRPMAVAPGRTNTVAIIGQNLDGASEVWTSFPSRSRRTTSREENNARSGPSAAFFDIEVPDSVAAGVGAVRIAGTAGVSSWHLLAIDPFSTTQANGTNDRASRAQPIAIPGAVEGRVGELQSQFFQVAGARGERLFVDVMANRLGSAMDPLLRVLDANGREIALVEDTPGLGADVALGWKLPRRGEYRIEVRDTLHRGGESFRYRLRVAREPLPGGVFRGDALPPVPGRRSPGAVAEQEPNDAEGQAQAVELGSRVQGRFNKIGDRDVFLVTAGKNQRLMFAGRTRSVGSSCDLFLQLTGTNGALIAEANVSGSNEGTITNTFKAAGTYHLVVEELNRGGAGQSYQLDFEELRPGFALAVNQQMLSVAPGGKVELPVTIERREFEGPVTLDLPGLPEGFVITNNVFQGKGKELKVQLLAPQALQMGDWFHFSVRGRGTNDASEMSATASTFPALRNLWPRMLHPPEALDGWLALGIMKGESQP